MKKTIFSLILVGILCMSACSFVAERSTYGNESSPSTSVDVYSIYDSVETNDAESVTVDEEINSIDNTEVGGTYESCTEHVFSYHSVSVGLMNYVGQDNFTVWYESCTPWDEYGRATEDFTITTFVNHFDIPREVFETILDNWATEEYLTSLGMTREEYDAAYGYTDEQINAIYSGDQAQINEAFCGDMAYFNEEDGQLYSIYWLSDHTVEEFAAADIPVSEVNRILNLAQTSGGGYAELAIQAESEANAYLSSVESEAVTE